MHEESPDRRTISRAATWRKAVVSLLDGRGSIVQGTAIDISPDGLRVVSPVPLAVGAAVEVLLPPRPDQANEAPITVNGRVAWCSPESDATHAFGIMLREEAPPATDATGLTRADVEDLLACLRAEMQTGGGAGRKGRSPSAAEPNQQLALVRFFAMLLLLLFLLWGSYSAMRSIDWQPGSAPPGAPQLLDAPQALNVAQEALLAGDTVQATGRFEELMASGPTPAIRLIAALGLADTLRQQGRAQEAVVALRKGIGVAGDAPKAWRDLARQFEGQLAGEGALAEAPPLLVNALDLLPPTQTPLATESASAQPPTTETPQESPVPPPARPADAPAPPPAPAEGPIRLEVDASDYVLTVYRGESEVAAYPVGLGMENATPQGDFVIANKIQNPDWFNRGETVKSGDPRNPLGALWMGLGDKKGPTSYGIHPTNESESIGGNRSRGCVRMRPADAAALFEICPLGTPVHIRE